MATTGGIPTLSSFSAVIRASCNINLGFAVNIVLLRYGPKALSSYKEKLFNCITLYDPASSPSRQSFARICLPYSLLGPMSSAAEGQWSHFQSQFKLHPPSKF